MADVMTLRPDALAWREADREIIALDLCNGVYLAVNGSGSVVWTALQHGASLTQLTDAVCDEYGLDRERGERDVAAFVEQLHAHGLLEADGLTARA